MDKERIIKSLEWMVTYFKWQHENTGIGGGYSPELREAIDLLEELKSDSLVFMAGQIH